MRWEIYIAAIMLASLIIAIETVYTMADHHRTRTFGVITVFGVVAFPIAVVIHNFVSAVLGTDEAVSFIVGAVVSPAAITIGALGVAFELRAENTLASAGFGLFGAGISVFPLYVFMTLAATAVQGQLPAQDEFQATMLFASLIAVAGGVIASGFGIASESGRSERALQGSTR